MMTLCSPGIVRPLSTVELCGRNAGSRPSVHLLMAIFTSGLPQISTNATRSMYGSHAMRSSAGRCRFGAAATGWSPSSRSTVLGFHNFSTKTITPMQVSELMMSVSSGPQKFET